MKWIVIAALLSGCAVGHQSIAGGQYGWTIGPATMTTTSEAAHAGWCWEGDVILQPGDERAAQQGVRLVPYREGDEWIPGVADRVPVIPGEE